MQVMTSETDDGDWFFWLERAHTIVQEWEVQGYRRLLPTSEANRLAEHIARSLREASRARIRALHQGENGGS